MSETGGPSRNLVRFWTWRDNLHQRLSETHAEDVAHHEAFVSRAQELRDEIEFLARNGLNEGAEETLGTLAEQDMTDFCIMVDLAADVSIDDIVPLDAETRLHLTEFLDNEPWHSLAVDTDMTVALAMIEDVAAGPRELPWYEVSPNLMRVTARVLDQANAEQVRRFAAELNALHEASGTSVPPDAAEIIGYIVGTGRQPAWAASAGTLDLIPRRQRATSSR